MGAAPNAERRVRYCIAVSEEELGRDASVVFQGGLRRAMERAGSLGYDSVEIHIRNPERWSARQLLDWSADSGVTIDAVGTGLEYSLNRLSFTSPDADVRRETGARFESFVELAAPLGAIVFVGLCRGTAPDDESVDEYLDRFAHELLPLAAYAAERNVALGLEPIAPYMTSLLTTTPEAIAFCERPGLETLRLLMDTHHMCREPLGVAGAFRAAADRIGHVHISDSDRLAPGSGTIDFTEAARALDEIGYEGAVSLEVLPQPDDEAAARRGIAWMRSMWG
jgi:sugar phosphate isomerase/epimerase